MLDILHPPPAPPAFGENDVVPEKQASFLLKLSFSWLGPFLSVGFSRPLQKEDLWQLPSKRLTGASTNVVEKNFYARCPSEQRPAFLRDSPHPAVQKARDSGSTLRPAHCDAEETNTAPKASTERSRASRLPQQPPLPASPTKYDSSLLKALHTTYFWRWWTAGALKLFSDTLKTTTPLLNKVILAWLTNSYIYYRATDTEREHLTKPQSIGYGIGLAFALFAMQEVASLTSNHFMQMTMVTGLCVRTTIIGTIFRKSLRLSGRARVQHSVGQITTMISTDASRLDRSCFHAHNLWVAPIQIVIGIGLLIGNLGYSALVGLAVLVFGFPIQFYLVRVMFSQRRKGVAVTDQRVRLTTEVLQGIRLLKFYAWEAFYAHQIGNQRTTEVQTIRRRALARSLLISIVMFQPILASILSFIMYALTGHDLNVAIIFSSLQIFNIIRAPLLQFPTVITVIADAVVALGRISKFLTAEELSEPYHLTPSGEYAIDVDGDFKWETAYKPGSFTSKSSAKTKTKPNGEKSQGKTRRTGLFARREKEPALPMTTMSSQFPKEKAERKKSQESDAEKPFELTNIKLQIPKGAFVAIVGRVGSGKSSLLQGLIGEMRRTRGNVSFTSGLAYVPQSAWIMNASLRQNIVFGREEDDDWFREIVKACSLEHDLELLPDGENTEIGEKGINLSGGQKARVSLARAAYSGADIVLMDDSLSAVDAYVGRQILENCLLSGPLAGKTRVLATHALHVLDKTDYIYVMENGTIVEQGTFKDLMASSIFFSRIMEEYGTLEKEKAKSVATESKGKGKRATGLTGHKGTTTLMQAEERVTGSVAMSTYASYLRFSGGLVWGPTILLLLILTQGSQVANNIFLGFWTAESIPGFSQAAYMATYAGLGVATAVFSFSLSFSVSLSTLVAGFQLFNAALLAVLKSPVSFFDTTPMGRVMSRFSKDQDTLDNDLAVTAYQLISSLSSVIGTVALIFYTFPYLGIMFFPLTVLYLAAAIFYRRSSVETKRLDSLMRSSLYASYSETLTGLSTVRGYGEQDRFIHVAEAGLDMENRAYYMTIAIQRWLGVRLDLLGNFLILGIALFASGFRQSVDPSKTGVVLSYTLSITQTFSDLVSTYAQNEQNFNAAERVLYYTELEPEGQVTRPDDPPYGWPEQGAIRFNDVKLAYRPGLPLVLKGVTFDIRPGEKVGVVGRTGAGKSSLLQALFRIVNLEEGTITIDGRDIKDMGLGVLRSRLALVPQDSTLFLGTLRDNLDPQGTRTDAEIISALKRSWLLPQDGASMDPAQEVKFSLDSAVSDEGSNYSAGEKQLLALCRALVKNSRIIVLDEATSNVDVETDAKIQKTIQTEFSSSTLLCIAHRLNTIVYYDRILVMDAGQVAEFDTPLNLFDKTDSIFRSLCNEAGLTRQDIVRIRSSVAPIPSSSLTVV